LWKSGFDLTTAVKRSGNFFLETRIHIAIPDYKLQSAKDNFHNPIFRIDKMAIFSIFDSTIPMDLIREIDGPKNVGSVSMISCPTLPPINSKKQAI